MRSPVLWFALTLLAILAMTALGPAERSLGTNVRAVYLHGAWVWAALIYILALRGSVWRGCSPNARNGTYGRVLWGARD